MCAKTIECRHVSICRHHHHLVWCNFNEQGLTTLFLEALFGYFSILFSHVCVFIEFAGPWWCSIFSKVDVVYGGSLPCMVTLCVLFKNKRNRISSYIMLLYNIPQGSIFFGDTTQPVNIVVLFLLLLLLCFSISLYFLSLHCFHHFHPS